MTREKGDFGRSKLPDKAKGQATDFPLITNRDSELKTTQNPASNPASEEDSPLNDPT